jgi:hypothetical protein
MMYQVFKGKASTIAKLQVGQHQKGHRQIMTDDQMKRRPKFIDQSAFRAQTPDVHGAVNDNRQPEH